jgi:hypothetical protein
VCALRARSCYCPAGPTRARHACKQHRARQTQPTRPRPTGQTIIHAVGPPRRRSRPPAASHEHTPCIGSAHWPRRLPARRTTAGALDVSGLPFDCTRDPQPRREPRSPPVRPGAQRWGRGVLGQITTPNRVQAAVRNPSPAPREILRQPSPYGIARPRDSRAHPCSALVDVRRHHWKARTEASGAPAAPTRPRPP